MLMAPRNIWKNRMRMLVAVSFVAFSTPSMALVLPSCPRRPTTRSRAATATAAAADAAADTRAVDGDIRATTRRSLFIEASAMALATVTTAATAPSAAYADGSEWSVGDLKGA